MSFEYEGITSDRLTTLWPGIQSKISPQQLAQLDKHMESMFADKSGANVADLLDFIQICCEYKAQNFEEYVALIMIATGIELLNDVPISLRPHKSRLVSHVFNCHVELWSNDQDKVNTKKSFQLYSTDIFCLNVDPHGGWIHFQNIIEPIEYQPHHYGNSQLQPIHIQRIKGFAHRRDEQCLSIE